MKDWITYQNQDCVMQFLMGLNESYTQIRAQILMMDPIPTISKIFALVIQEERQRSIHNDFSGSSTDRTLLHSSNVAIVRGPSSGKGSKPDKPICSHCKFSGHTIDKCYQIHGYPPGFPKHKQKPAESKDHANQVQTRASSTDTDRVGAATGDTLSSDQCKQLIAFLSSQLQLGCGKASDSSQLDPSVSCFTGPKSGEDDWDGSESRQSLCAEYFQLVVSFAL